MYANQLMLFAVGRVLKKSGGGCFCRINLVLFPDFAVALGGDLLCKTLDVIHNLSQRLQQTRPLTFRKAERIIDKAIETNI